MGIAVVAVGTFALPTTMSLFSGQHTWYALHDDKLMPCQKCHADIFEELEMSGFHKWNGGSFGAGNTSHVTDLACYGCHRANASITYADVGTTTAAVTPGEEAHAASTVACMLCHQFNASGAVHTLNDTGMPNAGYAAGGFAKPNAVGYIGVDGPYNYTNGSSQGGHAAHQTFIESAINWSAMEDSNEACIACHTHAPVNITWVHAHDLEFTATYEPGEGYFLADRTHFNVTGWEVNGTVYNSSYGNYSGNGSTDYWVP